MTTHKKPEGAGVGGGVKERLRESEREGTEREVAAELKIRRDNIWEVRELEGEWVGCKLDRKNIKRKGTTEGEGADG